MPDLTPLWISIKRIYQYDNCLYIRIFICRTLYKRKGHATQFLESLILLPIVLPPTVLGFILIIVFHLEHLWANSFKMYFTYVVFTMTGAVIASVIVSFPLMYQHTIQGFRSINPKMLNTARTMGASERKIFYRLILPLSKRSIIAGIMMSFARAIGEFGATLMVAGYIPNKTNTLPLEIYF